MNDIGKIVIAFKDAFSHVRFRESDHVYYNVNTGETYTSVTTFIKQFQKPFNTKYWLPPKYAKNFHTIHYNINEAPKRNK